MRLMIQRDRESRVSSVFSPPVSSVRSTSEDLSKQFDEGIWHVRLVCSFGYPITSEFKTFKLFILKSF